MAAMLKSCSGLWTFPCDQDLDVMCCRGSLCSHFPHPQASTDLNTALFLHHHQAGITGLEIYDFVAG